MSEKNQTIQNSITVSNSDIVTMMVHKNREHIEKKKIDLIVRRIQILDEMQKDFINQFKKHVVKHADYDELDLLLNVLNKKNPKIKITYKESLKNNFPLYQVYDKIPTEFDIKLKSFCVEFILNGIEYTNDNYDSEYWDLMDSLNLPSWMDNVIIESHHFHVDLKKPFVYKVKYSKELIEISDELNKCNEYLRDENKLKESLISRMTEKTLMNMPELQYITKDILLLQ